MHFTNILPLLLSTWALASPVLLINDISSPTRAPIDAAKIVQDFSALSKKLTTLNNTLNTFAPFAILSVGTADKIQAQTASISDQITRITEGARVSASWSVDESYNVAFATVNLLNPLNTTLLNIIAHKRAFATAVLLVGDLSKTVLRSLEEQRALTQTLGLAVQSKLAEPYASSAPLVLDQLLGLFDEGVGKYRTCKGVLCLPAGDR